MHQKVNICTIYKWEQGLIFADWWLAKHFDTDRNTSNFYPYFGIWNTKQWISQRPKVEIKSWRITMYIIFLFVLKCLASHQSHCAISYFLLQESIPALFINLIFSFHVIRTYILCRWLKSAMIVHHGIPSWTTLITWSSMDYAVPYCVLSRLPLTEWLSMNKLVIIFI